LRGASEPERYGLLCALLSELATAESTGANGRGGASDDQLEARARELGQKLKLEREKSAGLQNDYDLAVADLQQARAQLEVAQRRITELDTRDDEGRAEIKSVAQERDQANQELTKKNAAVYELENQIEALQGQVRKLEFAGSDQSRVESLEDERKKLTGRIDEVRAEMDRLRTDKDAEIEELSRRLRQSDTAGERGGDKLLEGLWDRLARSRPPLAQGSEAPNTKAAERLTDALIECFGFTHRLDQDMRVVLERLTKHNADVKQPWRVYADRDDFHQILTQTLNPEGGRPVSILGAKLKAFHKFVLAGMLSNDAAIESIAGELRSELLGEEHGAGKDPKLTVKDYVKAGGHEYFMERIRKLRSAKLAEVFRGV
jgi:prefoldin subunit 5